jgi:hypothetical protein
MKPVLAKASRNLTDIELAKLVEIRVQIEL